MSEFLAAHWLDIVTTVLGLVYIWLEYRAHIALWVIGIIMPALDIWLYWSHGLYGDAGMACYYTLAAFYGLFVWKFKKTRKKKEPLPIIFMPRNRYLPVVVFFFAAWAATYFILITWTNSTVPVLDSFTNALSFVGLWALARKYVEQWLFWIVVDVVCTVLYIHKGIPFKAMLYGLYVVIATAGYQKWKREAKAAKHDKEPLTSTLSPLPSFDAVIVANGVFPSHPVPLSILKDASHIVCCDGAVSHVPSAEAIVGDGDSVPEEYRTRLIQVDEQEDNDLTKATRYCLSKGWRRLAYLGATGLREDHTIGNVALLMRYFREMDVEATMYTDYGLFTPARGDRHFTSTKGQQVSILNFGCKKLESEGLRWQSYAYDELWQGTLNEATGSSFTLKADDCYVVFQTYETKSQNNTI